MDPDTRVTLVDRRLATRPRTLVIYGLRRRLARVAAPFGIASKPFRVARAVSAIVQLNQYV